MDPGWERFEARARIGTWIVAAAVVVIAFVARWRPGCLSPPDDAAQRTAIELKHLAYEAFPAWLASDPRRVCPTSLADLADFASHPEMLDAWGWHLVMRCEQQHFVVGSPGPDGMLGTDDDIWSDEAPHPQHGIFQ